MKYVMGHSSAEVRRLEAQAQLYDWTTRAVLKEAGVCAGMSVFDVGCGAGDVAMIAADLVGSEGWVLAADMDPGVIIRARHRAQESGYRNIEFVQGDVRELASSHAGTFDAVSGRLVLLHQTDPGAVLTAVCRALRPGGVAAFCELDSTIVTLRHPPSELHGRAMAWIFETLQRAGFDTAVGSRMQQIFLDAGLKAPKLMAFTPMGGAADWPGFTLVAETLRSVMPSTLEFGIATEEEIGIDNLADRLRDEISGRKQVISLPTLVGAWAVKRHQISKLHAPLRS